MDEPPDEPRYPEMLAQCPQLAARLQVFLVMRPAASPCPLSAHNLSGGEGSHLPPNCYGFRPLGLDACLGIELGGAALALGAHRGCLLYLAAPPHLPPFFRFVALVTSPL
jgi:hypothetical protein